MSSAESLFFTGLAGATSDSDAGGSLWCFPLHVVSWTLLSVLPGRPLVPKGTDKDTFGRFSGLGVPGPLISDLSVSLGEFPGNITPLIRFKLFG